MTQLVVSEIFGPTFQGEGPGTGRLTAFLRLGLCNLDCAWCDTPYTWDWTGKNGPPQDKAALVRMDVDAVVEALELIPCGGHLVITGGEPLLQRTPLIHLTQELAEREWYVEVETNGTLTPGHLLDGDLVNQWNVSPKLPHSGVELDQAWDVPLLSWWYQEAGYRFALKVVCRTEDDVEMVDDLREVAGIDRGAVWIMPEGRTAGGLEARGRELADTVLRFGFNLSGRMHVQLWGDVRGR